MPRNTYGDTVKKRVKRLLEALLDFVNCEFEGNFDIELKWEAEDITNPKVIFKTTLVALEQLIAKDKYPGKLKKEQIREALKLLENFLKILKDNRTKTQGSDDWHFTLTLWSKDREKNLKQFDNVWEESRPEKSKTLVLNSKKSDEFDWHDAYSLGKILKRYPLSSAVSNFKSHMQSQISTDRDFDLYCKLYDILWHCAQTMPYPDFYQAWHQDTLTDSATASLNLANLPQILAEAIHDRPDLCNKVKLICIDSHQLIDPENPAPEIYDRMLDRDCPEWQNGYPDTMQKLKLYWNYLHRISEIPLFFICYDSTALCATPTGFSDTFLKALSKFDRAICVVREPGNIPLQTFSTSQPNLIADIANWIKERKYKKFMSENTQSEDIPLQ